MHGGLDASEYKATKEAFFHDLHGTTHWEVFALSQCMPLLLCLGENFSATPECMQAPAAYAAMGKYEPPSSWSLFVSQGVPSQNTHRTCNAVAEQPKHRLSVLMYAHFLYAGNSLRLRLGEGLVPFKRWSWLPVPIGPESSS